METDCLQRKHTEKVSFFDLLLSQLFIPQAFSIPILNSFKNPSFYRVLFVKFLFTKIEILLLKNKDIFFFLLTLSNHYCISFLVSFL